MTAPTSRTVANVVLGMAGLAAAYVVWTTPPLRRLALRTGRTSLRAGVPALLAQVGRAWAESKPPASLT